VSESIDVCARVCMCVYACVCVPTHSHVAACGPQAAAPPGDQGDQRDRATDGMGHKNLVKLGSAVKAVSVPVRSVCVCVCVSMRVCVRARACVRACVYVYMCAIRVRGPCQC
jgi:hypothetical protein